MDTIDRLNRVADVDVRGLGKAIDNALIAEVNDEFEEFCEGLDLDYTDRFYILGGFIERKSKVWLEEPELFHKFLDKVLDNYKPTKRSARRKRC